MKRAACRAAALLACVLLIGCGAREERHYELALRYKESGDYDKAIAELQAAIKANPKFAKGYNQLGILYGKVSLYDKAAESFKRAVELDPSFASAHYNLGVLYQAHLNAPADAVRAYRRYLELGPGGARADAVERIVQGLTRQPDVQAALAQSADEQMLIAQRRAEEGDYEGAVKAYARAVEREPRAASRAHLEMARLLDEKLDAPAEALTHYQAYLEANLNAPDAADVMAAVGRLRERLAAASPARAAPAADITEAEKLLGSGDAARAMEILRRASEGSPDDERIHDLLAEAFMKSGDLRGAEKEYEWLKSRQADFAYEKELVSVYKALGESCLESRSYGEAEERFVKALEIDSNDGALRWDLARALAGSGRFDRAMEEASLARDLLPGAVNDSALSELYTGYGRSLILQGQYDKAAEAFEEARRLRPGLDQAADMADLYEGRARAASAGGNLIAAERDYGRALSLEPRRWKARRELAAVYEQTGQYDKAIAELERTAEEGKDVAALKEMARIYETYKGDGTRAIAAYRRYLAARPRVPDAAEVEKKIKAAEREKEQIVEYERAVKRSPSSAPNYYNLGVLLQRQGKFREAIDAYRKALALEPANPQARFNLGYSYDRLRMYEEAIAEYRSAIQYKPDYLKAYSNLGAIYKDKKWYGKAIATFQKALQIDPNYAQAHLGLGTIYSEGLHDRQKAATHYREYLRLQPNGTYAPQVRAWLGGRG